MEIEATPSSTPEVSTTRIAQPRNTHFKNLESTKNMVLWESSPLVIVGSTTADLSAYPQDVDTVSRPGTVTRRYTTYSCLSSSYLCTFSVGALLDEASTPTSVQTLQIPRSEYDLREPTQAELDSLNAAERNAYLSGEMVLTVARGFLTRAAHARKMLRMSTLRAPAIVMTNVTSYEAVSPAPSSSSAPQVSPPWSGVSTSAGPAVAAPPAPSLVPSMYSTKVIPIRYSKVNTMASLAEQGTTPFTSAYQTYKETLANTQTTTIKAAVKSLSIRDTTSNYVLCSALERDSGSYFDVAPLTRIALQSHALCPELAAHDTTPSQFFRNLDLDDGTVAFTPRKAPAYEYQIIAMTIDTFVAYLSDNEFSAPLPAPFEPSGIDKTWTAVPFEDAVRERAYAIEYITSFVSSELTWGSATRTWSYTVIGQNRDVGTLTSFPASATAYIDGPKNVILVLTDRTAANTTEATTIEGTTIPVWTGNNTISPHDAVRPEGAAGRGFRRPIDLGDMYNRHAESRTADAIRQNLKACWNYMTKKIAVGASVGQALAMAADCSSAIRPGMYVHPSQAEAAYDTNRPLSGGYAIGEGATVPLPPPSRYTLSAIDLSKDQTAWAPSALSGFNFAALSSTLLPPTGLAAIAYRAGVPVLQRFNVKNSSSIYTIPSSGSIKRVSTYTGLIETTSARYSFETPSALGAWVHMLSLAQMANTTVFLLTNDIPVRDWTGFNNDWSDYDRVEEMAEIKGIVSNGRYTHMIQELAHDTWPDYDQRWIPAFYSGMDPYDARAWGSHSPIPTHFTMQWLEKLRLGSCPNDATKTQLISVLGKRIYSTPVSEKEQVLQPYILGSFDTTDYHPILVDRSPGSDNKNPLYGSWVDQFYHFSCSRPNMNARAITQTTTPMESLALAFTLGLEPRTLNIVRSDFNSDAWPHHLPRVSAVQYPDPPSVADMLSAAKNYVLNPALAALGGFVTGGPIAAAASGIGALVGQGLDDWSKNKEKERLKSEIVGEVSKTVLSSTPLPAALAPPVPDAVG